MNEINWLGPVPLFRVHPEVSNVTVSGENGNWEVQSRDVPHSMVMDKWVEVVLQLQFLVFRKTLK